MKRILIYAVGLALLAALPAACGEAGTPQPEATPATRVEPTRTPSPSATTPPPELSLAPALITRFRPYASEALSLRLEYPEDWLVVERLSVNTVLFMVPLGGAEGGFRANVSVAAQEVESPEVTLQDYTDAFLDQAPDQIDGFRLLHSEPAALARRQAQRMVYVGVQSGLTLEWLQVWTLKGGRAYVVTYTAEQERFDRYLPQADYMISTLEIALGPEACR